MTKNIELFKKEINEKSFIKDYFMSENFEPDIFPEIDESIWELTDEICKKILNEKDNESILFIEDNFNKLAPKIINDYKTIIRPSFQKDLEDLSWKLRQIIDTKIFFK